MEIMVEVNGLPEVVGGVVDEDCPKRRCWLPSKARGSRRVCSTRADSGCPDPIPDPGTVDTDKYLHVIHGLQGHELWQAQICDSGVVMLYDVPVYKQWRRLADFDAVVMELVYRHWPEVCEFWLKHRHPRQAQEKSDSDFEELRSLCEAEMETKEYREWANNLWARMRRRLPADLGDTLMPDPRKGHRACAFIRYADDVEWSKWKFDWGEGVSRLRAAAGGGGAHDS